MIEGLLLTAIITVSNMTREPSRVGWEHPTVQHFCDMDRQLGTTPYVDTYFQGQAHDVRVAWYTQDDFAGQCKLPNGGGCINLQTNTIKMPIDTRRCLHTVSHELDHLFGNPMVEHVGG